jgi:hypothetical protein
MNMDSSTVPSWMRLPTLISVVVTSCAAFPCHDKLHRFDRPMNVKGELPGMDFGKRIARISSNLSRRL